MNKEILRKGLSECGENITKEQEECFEKYSELLLDWNKRMNLTAVTDPDGISIKHFLDSVVPIYSINLEKNIKIADIGTGAGFPGIPIKIMRPDLEFTFIDSLNKRINFLKEVSKELKLEKAEFFHIRAEDAGRDKNFRGRYDFVVSRAVAPLKVLSEYALPLLKIGGTFCAYKSFDIDEELSMAKSMIGNLGGKIKEIKETKIPESDLVRKIVLIEKTKETPKEFPRRANKIK